MLGLHNGLFIFHILFGSAALILFWMPALTPKGSLDHIRFGRYYANVMYGVALSGALMSLLVLSDPLSIHGQHTPAHQAQQAASQIRGFSWFLLYLSLLTLTSVRHGILVLKCKQNRQLLRQPKHLLLTSGLVLGGGALLLLGLQANKVLHIIFALLGMILGGQMLHYSFRHQLTPRQWWIEHLGAMIGSGIGAYTAFFAFGGRQLLSGIGQWQLAFWIAPGVVGGLVITWLARKYQRQFCEQKAPTSDK